eukprot:CAMPEP_0170594980 /NCGR_PEP_ID=MMETSP0224-20130122/14298_1 /TAXON_ID=285029 /ORGANISM="Togula jolla, Strain CCCM 725" /LENGTH=106 /DNA_ID=CAMNT_0010919091 /DNA_START=53 /DNA_END=373 /DNA_ORIENTATION=+
MAFRTVALCLLAIVASAAVDDFLPATVAGAEATVELTDAAAPQDAKVAVVAVNLNTINGTDYNPSYNPADQESNAYVKTDTEGTVLACLFAMIALTICWIECCKKK